VRSERPSKLSSGRAEPSFVVRKGKHVERVGAGFDLFVNTGQQVFWSSPVLLLMTT
jgi:hypothetical protein